jgi:hypothetical protein
MRGLVKIHRGYHPCPFFRFALAVSVDVANEANTMASAMNIASNAIVSTTERDNPIRHTTSTARFVGGGCGERSWRRTPCARRANTVSVSPLPVSWITRFRSDRAAHHSIGRICNRSAPHATRGSLCLKAPDGRGWGPSKSLWVSPSDRAPCVSPQDSHRGYRNFRNGHLMNDTTDQSLIKIHERSNRTENVSGGPSCDAASTSYKLSRKLPNPRW